MKPLFERFKAWLNTEDVGKCAPLTQEEVAEYFRLLAGEVEEGRMIVHSLTQTIDGIDVEVRFKVRK